MSEVASATVENGLKQINCSGAVAKGFNCVVKSLLKGKAKIVFLADDVVKEYRDAITALCKKYDVKLEGGINKERLGSVLGQDSLKGDQSVRRHIGCGSCAVTSWGKYRPQVVEEFIATFAPSEAAPAEQ